MLEEFSEVKFPDFSFKITTKTQINTLNVKRHI